MFIWRGLVIFLLAPLFAIGEPGRPTFSCSEIVNPDKTALIGYGEFRQRFAELEPDQALEVLTIALNSKSTDRQSKFAAMVAFLDRSAPVYYELIETLPRFIVRANKNPFAESFCMKANDQLLVGDMVKFDRARILKELLNLASILTVRPTQSNFFPRSIPFLRPQNGFSSVPTSAPWSFVTRTLAKLHDADRRLTSTYDFLSQFGTELRLPDIAKGPANVISIKEIVIPLMSIALPVAGDALIFGEVSWIDPAIFFAFAMTAFYLPLKGTIDQINWQAVTRMNVYWYTSNLAKALLVYAVALGAYEVGKTIYYTTDISQAAVVAYQKFVAEIKPSEIRRDVRANEATFTAEKEFRLKKTIDELEAQKNPALQPQVDIDKSELKRTISRHGNYLPKF